MYVLKQVQQEAAKAWYDNKNRGIIVLPTGMGKTVVASSIMSKGNYKKIIIIVFNNELLNQWVTFIEEWKTDMISSGCINIIPNIEIKTIQSMYKKTDLIYDLLIVDEGHRKFSVMWCKFIQNNKFTDILFLTATEKRDDNRHKIFNNIGIRVVYRGTHQQGIDEGLLCEYDIINRGVSFEEEERAEYLKYHTPIIENIKKYNHNYNNVKEAANQGDILAQELIRCVFARKRVITNAENKLPEVINILKNITYKKCIIFTGSIISANRIKKRLTLNNIKNIIYHSKNKQNIQDFREHINVLVCVNALDEGLNVPDSDLAVLVNCTGQERKIIQRAGRVLRGREGKHAKVYNLYITDSKDLDWLKLSLKGLKGYDKMIWE